MVKVEKNENGTFYNINGNILPITDVIELKNHFDRQAAEIAVWDYIRCTYDISPDIIDENMMDDMITSYVDCMSDELNYDSIAGNIVEQYDEDIQNIIGERREQ